MNKQIKLGLAMLSVMFWIMVMATAIVLPLTLKGASVLQVILTLVFVCLVVVLSPYVCSKLGELLGKCT